MARVGCAFILSFFIVAICFGIILSVCHSFGIATEVTTLDHLVIFILLLALPFTTVVNKVLKRIPIRWRRFLAHHPESSWMLLRTTSIVLNLLSLALIIFGIFVAFFLDFNPGLAFSFAFATLFWGLSKRAKRIIQRLEAPVLKIQKADRLTTSVDNRPVILLLRSFVDDEFEYMSRQSFTKEYFSTAGLNFAPLVEGATFEEAIHVALSVHGNVIAIGRPDDGLAPLGAPRIYVPQDENWEDYVAEFMKECAVVVLVLGKSDGFRWEIDQLLEGKLLSKVILLFPPVSNKEKRERWSFFLDRLNASGFLLQCENVDISNVLLMTIDRDQTCQPIYGKTKSTTVYSAPIAEAMDRLKETA